MYSAMKSSGSGTFTGTSRIMHLHVVGGKLLTEQRKNKVSMVNKICLLPNSVHYHKELHRALINCSLRYCLQ
jgi:hypothetical protein